MGCPKDPLVSVCSRVHDMTIVLSNEMVKCLWSDSQSISEDEVYVFMSSYSETAYAEKKHECHTYMSVFHFDYLYSPTFAIFLQNWLHSVKFRIMQ